ncbi:hypothetical protein A2W14_07295 [Candidatus Gottesmanbacteria bacterium RBG_16_37_8]|uniref:PABS domain-containing protein n=1 Tax=Candidatus Gottesmanbacteria bacterium RBG_16_37_8 TaxID=1798371 RepID=A0A1F5YPM5_9BACT|nr:MAG: hypothetical protein A2W14_07295 [Candidatus Gottesmanbacteria bacterium RBG_16_37_8]
MNFFSQFSSRYSDSYKSKINKQIKIVKNLMGKIVYVDGAEQTGGTITGMWKKALNKLPKTNLPAEASAKAGGQRPSALLLGLGGGDVVRLISKKYPRIKITAVEIDPVMIEVAKKYFNLERSANLSIIKNDAAVFLKKNKKKFDFIIVDLFIGRFNPQNFRRRPFLLSLKKSLTSHGLALYNSHYDQEKREEFAEFYKICRQVFPVSGIIIKYRFSRILHLAVRP